VHCSCCGRSYRRWLDYPSAYCPGCGSYERQRLLCLYLDASPELVMGDVLQVGPERSIGERFRARARSWLAVDIDPTNPVADRTMDVLSLDLPDTAFDLVLCSHVLDIVEEHEDRAVAELYRVTRSGGTALVQVPRPTIRGEPDAYAKRLARSGFAVTPVLLGQQSNEAVRLRLGLDRDDPLFVCSR
jgi:SAM-dependent methyltransferase